MVMQCMHLGPIKRPFLPLATRDDRFQLKTEQLPP
jgi:hypothetical protein